MSSSTQRNAEPLGLKLMPLVSARLGIDGQFARERGSARTAAHVSQRRKSGSARAGDGVKHMDSARRYDGVWKIMQSVAE